MRRPQPRSQDRWVELVDRYYVGEAVLDVTGLDRLVWETDEEELTCHEESARMRLRIEEAQGGRGALTRQVEDLGRKLDVNPLLDCSPSRLDHDARKHLREQLALLG